MGIIRPLLVLLLTAMGFSNMNSPRWEVIGPGGGGAQFHPTISPHDPKSVLVACDMTGAYVTHNGGESWRMFNLRQPVRFFAFDPKDPRTVYAQSAGLYRSEDGGATWSLVYPPPEKVTGVQVAGDHGEARLATTDGSNDRVTALAIDPADSRILYAAVEGAGAPHLEVSHDRGATWSSEGELPFSARHLYVNPRSPHDDRVLYLAGSSAVAVRQGKNWKAGPSPLGRGRLLDIVMGFRGGNVTPIAYAVSYQKLYVSEDAGATWRESSLEGPVRFAAVACCANHPEVAYASYRGLRRGDQTFHGVARTSDAGRTWKLVWQETEQPASNVHDPWITPVFGTGWGENPIHLGVAPSDPDVCYATDFGRTMRTTDGGKSWYGVYSRALDGGYTSTGLDVTTCYGVHFDPSAPRRLFISYTDIGLFRSENGGKSWIPSHDGVPRRWLNTTYWLAFDPDVQGRVWGVMSGVHDLPRPKMWREREPIDFNGGVCRSDDGGRTWQRSTNGMLETAATHILLDPHSPAGARTLYVTGFGRGVYKSTDGGAIWTLKNAGMEREQPLAWQLSLSQDGSLYLVVARASEDGSFGNAQDGALYRSTDGAEHWVRLPLPPELNGPNALTVDPRDAKRLYLSAWARDENGVAKAGGIYVSTDGGATWRRTLEHDQYIYDVTVDPRNSDMLYACGFSSSIWKSTDRGETWKRLRGYNFKWGHRVIPDPRDPSRLYVTTFGGSVWHGPVDGDRAAEEDIVTPVLRYSDE